jgi:hypothetical protein
MTARKACFYLSAAALLLGGIVLVVLMLAPLRGALFAILALGGLALLTVSLTAFVRAFQMKPGQVLSGNVLQALIESIFFGL